MFKKITRVLRNNILVGLALVTPIGVTILIANWLFQLVTNLFLPQQAIEDSTNQLLLRLAALVIVLMLLYLIGFFVRSFFGKRLYALGEKILIRIPVINKIYVQVRHISEAIVARRKTLFNEVVMIEYPRNGIYSIGFVTAPAPASFNQTAYGDAPADELVSLFVPTTPNPTSGLMVMMPRKDLHRLSISVADAMKFVVSAGAVHPGGAADQRPTLLDKLENWIAKDGDPDEPLPKESPDVPDLER